MSVKASPAPTVRLSNKKPEDCICNPDEIKVTKRTPEQKMYEESIR